MKRLPARFFEKAGRNKRITKKIRDRHQRTREILWLTASVHFGRVRSEAHMRAMKGKARRIGARPRHYRNFCRRMLPHVRAGYQATTIMTRRGDVIQAMVIRREHLDWYRGLYDVRDALHADGTKETYGSLHC
uniref:Uncharacterized protein n=1 Tax=Pseudomonas phage RVTF4 TaxID=3236931 RepID=A0AB39CD72_9VIRU